MLYRIGGYFRSFVPQAPLQGILFAYCDSALLLPRMAQQGRAVSNTATNSATRAEEVQSTRQQALGIAGWMG